jgi:ATP-dependent protease ClpP protease subunit
MLKRFLILGLVLLLSKGVWGIPITVNVSGFIEEDVSLYRLSYQIDTLYREMVYFRGEQIDTINIWITSFGGQVPAAQRMYDYIQELRRSGFEVNTIASGVCMSAAMIILQAGDTRYATEGCILLSHMPRYLLKAETEEQLTRDDAERIMRELDDQNLHLIKVYFAPRMKKEPAMLLPYFKTVSNVMTADEAFQIGFIDKVIRDPVYLYGDSIEVRNGKKIYKLMKEDKE